MVDELALHGIYVMMQSASKYFLLESGLALFIAFLINVAVISVTGSVCSNPNITLENKNHCNNITLDSASFLLKVRRRAEQGSCNPRNSKNNSIWFFIFCLGYTYLWVYVPINENIFIERSWKVELEAVRGVLARLWPEFDCNGDLCRSIYHAGGA